MSMRRIVACGGGNPTTSSRPFFDAGLDLTGAEKPKILLIPTAKYTQAAHDKIVGSFTEFLKDLGLELKVLHKFGELPSLAEATDLLGWANAAYITGGNARHMMRRWRESCLESLIYCAVDDGDITAIGTSAGLLYLYAEGQSDSEQYEVPEGTPWDYVDVEGLGIFDAYAGVHHDNPVQPHNGILRRVDFQQRLRTRPVGTVGVAADNSVAMRIVGNRMTVLGTDKPGFLHRMEVIGEREIKAEAIMPNTGEVFPLSLFTRVTT